MAGTRAGGGAVHRRIAFSTCAGIVAAACGVAAVAQPTIDSLPLAAAYGDGVHAYFAGDFQRAYEDLTQAIEAGSNDPRAFYFRGLAALRQGRSDEAEADFASGADRESQGLGAWPVSRSLERIQGAERLQLERHRMRARVASLQRQREAERRRYSQIESAQPDVLRRRRPVAPRLEEGGNVFEENSGPAERPGPAPEPVDTPTEPMPEPTDPAPSGDDPFGENATSSSKTEQVEELAAEREDRAAQRDEQLEMGASEAEAAADQADQQAEMEAAAGDR
jgi:hypothetical protein